MAAAFTLAAQETPADDTEYIPLERYTDVIALRNLIKNHEISGLTIPVADNKTGIEKYFRAVAKAFPDGLLGEALRAADGRRTEFSDTQLTLDSRNGYIKADVPYRSGEEGMQMCYWRGKEGRDVVALVLTYDAVASNNEFDEGQFWIGVFFRYDPESKTLGVVSSTGSDTYSLYSSEEQYCMAPVVDLMLISYLELPREGKTINYLNMSGELVCSCVWDADLQWFVRNFYNSELI